MKRLTYGKLDELIGHRVALRTAECRQTGFLEYWDDFAFYLRAGPAMARLPVRQYRSGKQVRVVPRRGVDLEVAA